MALEGKNADETVALGLPATAEIDASLDDGQESVKKMIIDEIDIGGSLEDIAVADDAPAATDIGDIESDISLEGIANTGSTLCAAEAHNKNEAMHKTFRSVDTMSVSDEENGITKEETPRPAIENPVNCCAKLWTWWCLVYSKYSFLILVVFAVILAYSYPPLGAVYLAPEITATWIAVVFIFALSGISLKGEELKNAFKRVKFNVFVQTFNFFAVSPLVFGISRFLLHVGALDTALADGMTICSCLPTSISMVMALTVSGKGDEASAVFHSAFGNMIGVFLTPVMILMYIGATGTVDLATVFIKLTCRVIIPIVVGQLLRKFYHPVAPFVAKHKRRLNKLSEWALVFIVYTVFCQTFTEKSAATIAQILTMVGVIFLILIGIMILSWGMLRLGFRDQPKLQVMGLFGCTHKTVAMGVPLISAIYQGNPLVGLYTLPVLVWYPMQLVLGTMVTPRLAVYVDKEEARIAAEKIASCGDEIVAPVEP